MIQQKKTVEWPAGIPRVSNLWVLLWVWLSKMNNATSSSSFLTSESSFCPPSGFAHDFVGRTWSGEWREFLSALGSKEDLERSELDQESKFGGTRNFEWSLLLSRSPWFSGQDSVEIWWFSSSSAFCDFLIWTPFLGQPWTNLIFSFWFLVSGGPKWLENQFFVSHRNKFSLQIPKLPSPVQEPRKIPQMIHQNSTVLQNPKILQIPLKKVSISSNRKINQNSPYFPPKLTKSCSTKKSSKFPKGMTQECFDKMLWKYFLVHFVRLADWSVAD